MTDVTTPADEARISRRRALQAGVAAGVGAIAWTGPTITSMGGTPAYADGCTGFTVNLFADDRNTNQGGCSGKFRYQDDSGITLPPNYTWDWGTQECPGNTVNFDYPTGISCSVDIYLYASSSSSAGNWQNYWALNTFDLPDSGGSFVLPDGVAGNVLNPPPPDSIPSKFSDTRFAVRVQCIKTDQADCL